MSDLIFNEIKVDDYELVLEVINEKVGLHAVIAIHNSKMGPALGGIRAYPYPTFDAALTDVLRLAKGMTYKSAVSEAGTGGAKSVIITDSRQPKSEELLRAFGEAINRLEGEYTGAEDVGMPPSDLEVIGKETSHLVGLPNRNSSGDPSRFTSYGGYLGVKAVAQKLWDNNSLKGKVIAIQGLGAVGRRLAEHLFWEGAQLVVTDVNQAAVEQAVFEFGARAVDPDEIYSVDCDIFAPCALGGILNPTTIPLLRCKGVAGLANNQLLTEADGEALMERGILYAPDYVINSGGLLCVCTELEENGFNALVARSKVERIYNQLLTIFTLSDEKNLPTNTVANELAEYNLENGIGKRQEKLVLNH